MKNNNIKKRTTIKLIQTIILTALVLSLALSAVSCGITADSAKNAENFIPDGLDINYGMSIEQVGKTVEEKLPDYDYELYAYVDVSGKKIYTAGNNGAPNQYVFVFEDDKLTSFQLPFRDYNITVDELYQQIKEKGFELDVQSEQLEKEIKSASVPPFDASFDYCISRYDDKNSKTVYTTNLTTRSLVVGVDIYPSFLFTSAEYGENENIYSEQAAEKGYYLPAGISVNYGMSVHEVMNVLKTDSEHFTSVYREYLSESHILTERYSYIDDDFELYGLPVKGADFSFSQNRLVAMHFYFENTDEAIKTGLENINADAEKFGFGAEYEQEDINFIKKTLAYSLTLQKTEYFSENNWYSRVAAITNGQLYIQSFRPDLEDCWVLKFEQL